MPAARTARSFPARPGHLGVAACLPVGDLGDRALHPAAEAVGELPVKRQPESLQAALEVEVELAPWLIELGRALEHPRGDAGREVREQIFGVLIGQADPHQAALGGSEQKRPEG